MEIVSRCAAAAIVGCLFALLLKKYVPELSLSAVIVTDLAVLAVSFGVCSRIVDAVWTIARDAGVSSIYLAPVIKCVGIGLVTDLAAQVCRDAQQGSIASVVELCGTFCALYISLPLIESLLSVAGKLS